MRFPHVVSAVMVVFAAAMPAVAQNVPQVPLNALEVRQLVARLGPGDGARLGAHFLALADRYTAEARRHQAMGKSFEGNPSRNLGTGMRMHCQRLADLAERSATTVRQLAVFHDPSLADAPIVRPPDADRFEAGAGAPSPTPKEIEAMAARAATPSDHRVLEQYFRTQASRYVADANEHDAMARSYRSSRVPSAAIHHDRLAELARASAKEATAAAAMHDTMSTGR